MTEYLINGVKIKFPKEKAYPSQIAIMSRIVQSVKTGDNAIIESPTGTGKTLALLCACIAVQSQVSIGKHAHMANESIEETGGKRVSSFTDDSSSKAKKIVLEDYLYKGKPRGAGDIKKPSMAEKDLNDDDDDDFQEKSFTVYNKVSAGLKHDSEDRTLKQRDSISSVKSSSSVLSSKQNAQSNSGDKEVMRIYFGTRTHKQVSQIVAELRTTGYKPRLAILGSRNQLCIHKTVMKSSNRNEGCQQALEQGKCSFFDRSKNVRAHKSFREGGEHELFDIEDLVTVGKKVRGCPYFAARMMALQADIVVCPYNYLIDSNLRDTLDIQLKNSIVVFDEAHNIEDSCREAGSLEVTDIELQEMYTGLLEANKSELYSNFVEDVRIMLFLVESLQNWMNLKCENIVRNGFESEIKVWTGHEVVQILRSSAIKAETLPRLQKAFKQLATEKFDVETILLPVKSVYIIKSLLRIFKHLLVQKNGERDFQLAIVQNKTISDVKWKFKLGLWCLNPAVVFQDIGEQARSVILASGTLAPLNSFASELGVPFKQQFEGNHIVGHENVWAGVVDVLKQTSNTSESEVRLKGVFTAIETFQYQDGVGQIVLDSCRLIPNGVLCFFPSYTAMERLRTRWKSTGIMNKISSQKHIIEEPRNAEDFEKALGHFYSHASNENSGGAIFFAVYRGKISEGIDFSDSYARGVIAIGIPFPHLKDIQVKLKREYNDKYSKTNGLLSGGDWYDSQAFRAYNQALGRCIRHKNDWGALIMVDSRLRSIKYQQMLSKWIRQRVKCYDQYKDFEDSLNMFVCKRLDNQNE